MVAFSEMTSPLTIHEQSKIAIRYEVGNFIVLVQRWWDACKGRHETETITDGPAKFTTTDTVKIKEGTGVHSQVDQRRRWKEC